MLFHIKMFDLLVTLPLSEPLEYLKAPILYDFVFLFFALLVTSYELSFKKYALWQVLGSLNALYFIFFSWFIYWVVSNFQS